MTTAVAKAERKTQISRPLKVLVPLIKDEIEAGNDAGLEHYRRAGDMLIEAKDQVARGSWGRWLTNNFELSSKTAQRYMKLSRLAEAGDPKYEGAVAIEDVLDRQPRRERHAVWDKVRDATERVNVTQLAEARQSRDAEIELHRKLALQLIELGYRALATRLHPDRGGSRDAMSRLNIVRDELKDIAATRRYV